MEFISCEDYMIIRVIQKAIRMIHSQGVIAILKTGYRICFPDRLRYLPKCKHFFVSKSGLEVGGPSGIFSCRGCIPVYSLADNLDNCNFSRSTVWEGVIKEGRSFVFNKRKFSGQQFIAEAGNLGFAPDNTYDFLLSSHCIEHLANPLQGLREWMRVLKSSGVLVLVIPHKDKTFDARRSVTALEHLIQDDLAQQLETDMTHFDEVLMTHSLGEHPSDLEMEALRQRMLANHTNRCMHHHVFDVQAAIEMINYMKLQILDVELFDPFHIVILARKVKDLSDVNNDAFLNNPTGWIWYDPPPFRWFMRQRRSK
jgi:SAM-dependent methyltransferase